MAKLLKGDFVIILCEYINTYINTHACIYLLLYFCSICSQANWVFREVLQLNLNKIFDRVLRLSPLLLAKAVTTNPMHFIKANINAHFFLFVLEPIIITFYSQPKSPGADAVSTHPFPSSLTILGKNFKQLKAVSLYLGLSFGGEKAVNVLGHYLTNN